MMSLESTKDARDGERGMFVDAGEEEKEEE